MDWRESLKSMLPDDYVADAAECEATEASAPLPVLTVTLDRKRAGKTATIIYGFDADDKRCDQLGALLKRKLAVGGSVRDGEILLQGDCRQKVAQLLDQQGYKAKIQK